MSADSRRAPAVMSSSSLSCRCTCRTSASTRDVEPERQAAMKVMDESEVRGWLARQACIVAPLLLSLACAAYPTRETNQRGASVERGIEDVHLELRDGSLYVHYRTRISIRDCDGHRAEMPAVNPNPQRLTRQPIFKSSNFQIFKLAHFHSKTK